MCYLFGGFSKNITPSPFPNNSQFITLLRHVLAIVVMQARHIDQPLDRPISVGEKYLRTEFFYLGTFFRNQWV
jgi:hypothetical protein